MRLLVDEALLVIRLVLLHGQQALKLLVVLFQVELLSENAIVQAMELLSQTRFA